MYGENVLQVCICAFSRSIWIKTNPASLYSILSESYATYVAKTCGREKCRFYPIRSAKHPDLHSELLRLWWIGGKIEGIDGNEPEYSAARRFHKEETGLVSEEEMRTLLIPRPILECRGYIFAFRAPQNWCTLPEEFNVYQSGPIATDMWRRSIRCTPPTWRERKVNSLRWTAPVSRQKWCQSVISSTIRCRRVGR